MGRLQINYYNMNLFHLYKIKNIKFQSNRITIEV